MRLLSIPGYDTDEQSVVKSNRIFNHYQSPGQVGGISKYVRLWKKVIGEKKPNLSKLQSPEKRTIYYRRRLYFYHPI